MVELQETARLPGTFIVFEGGEGTGKSTQLAILVERLQMYGHEVVATREPGGSAISEQIRRLILQDSSAGMSPRCEALLFAAARAEHVSSLIRPVLERDAIVVSDRFVDSSIAYQGVGRDLGQSDIAGISSWATGGIAADLTIVLDLDPAVGLARAQDPNRLEAEGLSFHGSVRDTLLSLAHEDSRGHIVVPADQTPEEVADEVWSAVETVLGERALRSGPLKRGIRGEGRSSPTRSSVHAKSRYSAPLGAGTESNPRSGSNGF